MIEVINLSASYSSHTVFENLNFSIPDNSFTALIGKNGSGKSTLLSLLDGIVPQGLKVKGEILIDGKNVFDIKRSELSKKVSYLVQKENPVWNMKVFDFVETGLYSFSLLNSSERSSRVLNALRILNIEDFSDKNIFNISGGEFQKCRLARCLVQNSDVLLFDEPSENLDLPFQAKFLQEIKTVSKEKSVLYSVHDINMASMCSDNFLLFSKGKLLSGTSSEIFCKEILETAFDANVKIYSHPETSRPQVYFSV